MKVLVHGPRYMVLLWRVRFDGYLVDIADGPSTSEYPSRQHNDQNCGADDPASITTEASSTVRAETIVWCVTFDFHDVMLLLCANGVGRVG